MKMINSSLIPLLIVMATVTACGNQSNKGRMDAFPEQPAKTEEIQATTDNDYDGDMIPNQQELSHGTDPLIADIPIISENIHEPVEIKILSSQDNQTPQILNSNFEYTKVNTQSNLLSKIIKREIIHSLPDPNQFIHTDKIPRNRSIIHRIEPDIIQPYLRTLYNENAIDIDDLDLRFRTKISMQKHKAFKRTSDLIYKFDILNENSRQITYLKAEHLPISITPTSQNEDSDNAELSVEHFLDSIDPNLIINNFINSSNPLLRTIDDFTIDYNDDFKLPSISYKKLINSIKKKTTTVHIATPDGTETFHMANRSQLTIEDILNKFFPDDFFIINGEINRIKDYRNSLFISESWQSFKDQQQEGQWFVLSNNKQIGKKKLATKFLPGDSVTLAYIDGATISNSFYQYKKRTILIPSTYEKDLEHPIGKVSQGDRVTFIIRGLAKHGTTAVTKSAMLLLAPIHYIDCAYYVTTIENFSTPLQVQKNLGDIFFDGLSVKIGKRSYRLDEIIDPQDIKIFEQGNSIELSLTIDEKIIPISERQNIELIVHQYTEYPSIGAQSFAAAGYAPNAGHCKQSLPGIQNGTHHRVSRSYIKRQGKIQSRFGYQIETILESRD